MAGKEDVTVVFKTQHEQTIRGIAQINEKLDELARKQRRSSGASREHKSATDAMLGSIRNLAMGFVGVAGLNKALGLANTAWRTYIDNVKEAATVSGTASKQYVALAALQSGGEQRARVIKAANVAARFGVTDIGTAWNITQSLQSARGGNFEAGLSSARSIFAASQMDVPLERGVTLERLGVTQGQGPGDAIRRAYIAGQVSSSNPATLATAASAMSFFKDKDVGFAIAAAVAGGVGEGELVTYAKRAGIGLSYSKDTSELYDKLGVGREATQLQRLKALAKAGLTTPEKLEAAGFGETREQLAISIATRNISKVEEYVSEIKARNKPGLFAAQRAGIEASFPEARLQREKDILISQAAIAQMLGPRAVESLEYEKRQHLKGRAFRELGYESAIGKDLVGPKGRASEWGEFLFRVKSAMGGIGPGTGGHAGGQDFVAQPSMVQELSSTMARIEAELAEINTSMQDVAASNRETADNTAVGGVISPSLDSPNAGE